MGGASSGDQLFLARDFEVILQAGNHHHDQRRTQRAETGLFQRLRGDFVAALLQRFNQQIAHALAGRAFDGQEAVRLELAMIRRAQGCAEHDFSLRSVRGRVDQSWNRYSIEQNLKRLHGLSP
ncbi:hypothetical protein ALP75_200270 [Pseudomonas syringae pv. actinidiae]|nr:hypothetical protein ALP75_200270 [Pseudomonas syringae pv. actinidiae]